MPSQSNMIPEHQAPIATPQNKSLQTQSTADQKTVKMALDLLAQGKSVKKDVARDWDERWDFYNDEQWDKKRPRNKSDAVLNVIKVTIQSLLPILTDAKPGFNVLPEEPDDFQFAQIISKLSESWWEKKDINHVLVEVLMDAMIYDAGIMKITWDPDAESGIGDVKTEVIDPREIYLPKDARDFNRGCSWVIQLMRKPIGELRRKFPKKADLITGDSQGTKKGDENERAESIREVTLVSPVDQQPTVVNRFPEGESDLNKTAQVMEIWMDDEALEEYEAENKDGTKETKVRKKYPFGKVITILPEKKLLLDERKNPYKHHKKPFVRFVDTILPRKFWGDGEVKPLMSIQRTLNKTLANIVDYMNFTSNPVWIVENDAGVNHRRITNSYGLVIRTHSGGLNKIKRDIPPPLPQYITNFYNILREAAETISGASDITQGRKPTGITAAAAIESVQEAAHTRVRLKERNLQVSLAQMGKMIISLMMQHYTEPRVARVTGEKGWPEFFEFHVSQDENDPEKVMFNKRDFIFDEESGEYIRTANVQQGQPSKGLFDIKVLSGTSLPFAKAQRSNLALRLFENAAIDQEELLEALEWPNKEKVLQRSQEQAAQEAQLPEGA